MEHQYHQHVHSAPLWQAPIHATNGVYMLPHHNTSGIGLPFIPTQQPTRRSSHDNQNISSSYNAVFTPSTPITNFTTPASAPPTRPSYGPVSNGHSKSFDNNQAQGGHLISDRSRMVTPPPSEDPGPPSPQKEEWVSTEVEMHDKETCRAEVKKALNSSSPIERSDGYRKKNAKFEIPKERTLGNLDYLIQHARDDNELREYKMHKRLLRNREAALNSRNKKKSHTAHLEQENSRLRQEVFGLREKIKEMRTGCLPSTVYEENFDRLRHDYDHLRHAHQQETSELRKQLSSLQQTLHTANNSPLSSNAPNSATFSDFAHEATSIPMDGTHWDKGFEQMGNYCLEPERLNGGAESKVHLG